MKDLAPVLMLAAVVLFMFAGGGYGIGHANGVREGVKIESARRADPAVYPKGSCSAHAIECSKRGGRFSVFHGGDYLSVECRKSVEVKLP